MKQVVILSLITALHISSIFAGSCPSSFVTSTTSSSTPIITPKPSCVLHGQDPDQGVTQAYCLCEGTVTLSPLSVPLTGHQSDSCSYTTIPTTSTISISTARQTYTSNCRVCTQIELNAPTCTSSVAGCTVTPTTTAVPTPTSTFVVNLSNNTVHVGDANSEKDGASFRDKVMSTLKSACLDPTSGQAGQCDTTKKQQIKNIYTVVEGSEMTGTLSFQFEDSSYLSTGERDRMLAVAVGAFQQAAAKSCATVDYSFELDPTQTGCHAPGKRRGLAPRAPIGPGDTTFGQEPDICDADMSICNGPNHINVVLAGSKGPYTNHMDIGIDFELGDGKDSAFDKFVCEMVITGLAALVNVVAPELAAQDWIGAEELQTILCT